MAFFYGVLVGLTAGGGLIFGLVALTSVRTRRAHDELVRRLRR